MAYYHQPMPASHLTGEVRDTTYTKVFVGGLAWETQSDSLRRFFEQFGDILEAAVINDKNTGRSKGYGFVTFLDPEAARRACENPSPVIDGRRANCNLASLGRLPPALSFGRTAPIVPFTGRMQPPSISFVGNPGYQQPSSYVYPSGYIYPPHGYTTYAPEYIYSQGAYNPYLSQQYYRVYSLPGAGNTGLYPYGQSGHPPGNHAYASIPNYMVPGQHIMQFGGQNYLNGTTTAAIQAPYPAGVGGGAVPGQAHIIVTAHSPQFTSGSDQTG